MIERRNIIDGQQRLLTLQLFLDAAHDVAAEYEDDRASLFAMLTDNNPQLVKTQMESFKVWPTNVDRVAFLLQPLPDETGDLAFVFDNQDPHLTSTVPSPR